VQAYLIDVTRAYRPGNTTQTVGWGKTLGMQYVAGGGHAPWARGGGWKGGGERWGVSPNCHAAQKGKRGRVTTTRVLSIMGGVAAP